MAASDRLLDRLTMVLAVVCGAAGAAAPAPQAPSPAITSGSAGVHQLLAPIVAQHVAVTEALRPAVDQAVTNACGAAWQAEAAPPRAPLPEAVQLQLALDHATHEVAALTARLQDVTETRDQPAAAPPPRQCQPSVQPQPAGAAPYQTPTERACARSCLQLRDQASGPPQNGVYWLTGLPVPVFCDFSHDGGGWTLLLTAATRFGWDVMAARQRNVSYPSLSDNYSILRYGDTIRDLGKSSRFAYRIEAQAETGRRRWGGVWLAPRSYSFVLEGPSQTDVDLVRQFDNWKYSDKGIKRRMPWLYVGTLGSVGYENTVLTTASHRSDWWGTLITKEFVPAYQHSPWIHPEAQQSGTILYWVREEED